MVQEQENEETTSLNKKIEELDKTDPEYAQKRDLLMESLQKLERELQKMKKKLKKQQEEMRIATKVLREYIKKDPENKELATLLNDTSKDCKFLTRAMAEIISVRGNTKNEINRLKGSQEFKLPLDVKAVTAVELKPLPSSRTEKRKEQINNQTKKKQPSLRQKIAALRMSLPQTTSRQTTTDRTRTR